MGGFAWVTLATNDSYSLGALILAHSLKQVGTSQQLAVLVTPGVTNAMRDKLKSVFDLVQEVNILDSKDEANLRLLKRPELGVTFTKLHCWRLTQFDKCVFLDADTLVLQNCDELFEREELSAAPDVGWPDCFNSGVFVYRPSNETYEKLVQFALEKGSFDGGDQGLLNLYFSDWAHKDISKHLPFIYNMCSTACYSYLPAFKQFGGNAKIIHFIGPAKPWLQYFDSETRTVSPSGGLQHLQHVLQRWWDIFCEKIHPTLSREMAGLAGAFAQLTLGVPRTAEQMALEDHLRRQGWEVGNIDYLGRDSFDNIWSKICETLGSAPEPKRDEPKEASELPKSKADETTKSKEPTSPTSSEVQSPQTPSEEVVTEKSEPASETKLIEQTAVLPTTQVVPATPTTPTEPEICPIKAPEVDTVPAPLPASVETPPPPQPEVCPLTPKSEVITTPSEEPPLPKVPETEAPGCPLAPKPSEEQPVPKSPQTETPACPLAPKPSEPTDQACPLTPKPEEPSKTEPPKAADSAPLPETLPSPKIPESPELPKSEALEEPKLTPAECSLPETATAPGEPSETLTECPLTPDPSGQKELIPQSPVETPVVPETPKTPTEAPKAAVPEPKPEPPKAAAPEPTKAAAPEPKPEPPKAAEPKSEPPKAAEPKPEPPKAAEPKAEPPKAAPKEEASSTTETTPTPTPPPRKGSGPKKVTKPKK